MIQTVVILLVLVEFCSFRQTWAGPSPCGDRLLGDMTSGTWDTNHSIQVLVTILKHLKTSLPQQQRQNNHTNTYRLWLWSPQPVWSLPVRQSHYQTQNPSLPTQWTRTELVTSRRELLYIRRNWEKGPRAAEQKEAHYTRYHHGVCS